MSHKDPTARAARSGPFRIGDFLVEPRRNLVSGPGGASVLEPKVVDVLCALAARQDEVVSRAELIDQVWGVEFGADESLTRAVSLLRKVFQDTRGEARIIETIPKRGYRLIAPVRPAEAAPADEVAATPPQAPRPLFRRFGRRRRAVVLAAIALVLVIAGGIGVRLLRGTTPAPAERTGVVLIVRPFSTAPLGRSPLGNRLAEELSTAVARSPLVRVKAEDAGGARARADPGATGFRLHGDVQRTGSRVRVHAELVDAATGEYVWADTYERPFETSAERAALVALISSELQLPLLRAAHAKVEARPLMSLVPWELVMLVTWIPGAEGKPPDPPNQGSTWLQERALKLAPDFAPAHALLAEQLSYHALFHPPSNTPQALARARRHAERAVELAPYDPDVLYHVSLHQRFAGDRARAAATLGRVLELHPSHPMARIDLEFVRGQCSADPGPAIERLGAIERDLSPSNPARWVALAHLSALHLARGDFPRARDAAQRSRRIVPMTWTAVTLAAAQAELGEDGEAARTLAEQAAQWPALEMGYFADRIGPRWCMDGARTPEVQATFRRLAAAVAGRTPVAP